MLSNFCEDYFHYTALHHFSALRLKNGGKVLKLSILTSD